MMSAVVTFMVDSITTSVFSRSSRNEPCADVASADTLDQEMGRLQAHAHHGHGLNLSDDKELGSSLQFL